MSVISFPEKAFSPEKLPEIDELELPEAEQFMLQFLPSFGMTLDDL